jgi:hypothetical protein
MGYFDKFLGIAFSYSAFRKLYYTKDLKYRKNINDKIEERPILYTDKLGFFVFGGCIGMWSFPILLFSDISKVEMYLREIKPFSEDNKIKNKEINYLSILFDDHM